MAADDLSWLVAGLEPDGKGAPVLLRQYLRLGGRVLGFNIDPAFANSLDCLILVDLRKTDPQVLRKYISESAGARFQRRHAAVKLLCHGRIEHCAPARDSGRQRVTLLEHFAGPKPHPGPPAIVVAECAQRTT